ncbi:MAG: penicillin-insensitive murein endopeptidase [Proteobacteria bacterium]|nr:penicillin-insensitive murein endopeptidase [Pseudomonadota bacterium]
MTGRALGMLFAAGCTLITSMSAFAQQTQTEEMERREKVLATLPANAAKRIFGTHPGPANMEARAIGSVARGCLAGAKALPVDGETWQVMRLSRNRNWGHPELISLVERLARRAPKEAGWPGLLVGDISQPRGGPMLTGHASHQIGLDADIWLTPMPDRKLSRHERETMSATNIARGDWMDVNPATYSKNHMALIRLAAREKAVSRIFVNPAIKVALCRDAGSERAWLSKVRPMWGHNYHFHIRIACPAGDATCTDQPLPADEDGCGEELQDWLKKQYAALMKPKPPGPQGKPKPPPKPWTLDDLPDECRAVAVAR